MARVAILRDEWQTGRTPLTGEVEVARVSGRDGCDEEEDEEEEEAGLGAVSAERGSSVWGWARRESWEGMV